MADTRLAHRFRLLTDLDAIHALAVAFAACVLSLGLVYVGYFLHVTRVARTAPSVPPRDSCVLLFGKHAPSGRPDPDFHARIARAAALWPANAPRTLLLLGGGPAGAPSEAELARRTLVAMGVPAGASLVLEDRSRDTLQNLRNARTLLQQREGRGDAGVVLLSGRYHLARCALLARRLGIEASLCAAEPRMSWRPLAVWRIATEAAYLCWLDIGTRWARLIGHRGMMSRVS